jgi:hypothetical protein
MKKGTKQVIVSFLVITGAVIVGNMLHEKMKSVRLSKQTMTKAV